MVAKLMGLVGLVVAALSLTAGPAAYAQVGNTEIVGGPGGGAFTDSCGDAFFVGFYYEGTKDINRLGGYCQNFVNGHQVSAAPNLPMHGALDDYHNSSLGSVLCPRDTAVEGMVVGVSGKGVNLVHDVKLICRNPLTHDYVTTAPTAIPGGETTYSKEIGCGGGAIATGLVGRSGSLIDALGLQCKVIAAAAPPPPPARAPPPPPRPSGPTQPEWPPAPIDNNMRATPNGAPAGPPIGGGDGTSFVASCAPGQALVGWGYNATGVLTGIGLVCQSVVDDKLTGAPDRNLGFFAGADVRSAKSGPAIVCPANQAVWQLVVFLTPDQRVHHIRANCHLIKASGVPTSIHPTLTVGGGASAPQHSQGCNVRTSYATGVAGTFSEGGITSLGLLCFSPEAGPSPPQAGGGSARVVVRRSVELYTAPGGQGDLIGDLDAGTDEVALLEPCQDNWCHVRWPGHEGWVYSGPDYQSIEVQ